MKKNYIIPAIKAIKMDEALLETSLPNLDGPIDGPDILSNEDDIDPTGPVRFSVWDD